MNKAKVKRSKRNIQIEKLEKMANILKAISHPQRLEVLEILEESEPLTVSEILNQIDIDQSLLSHHLTKMKDKGVLVSFRRGKNVCYQLKFEEVTKIFDCMDQCDFL